MEQIKFTVITEDGMKEEMLDVELTGTTTEHIISDSDFENHFGNSSNESKKSSFEKDSNKVCVKTTITSIEHPFQFKTEIDDIIVRIPFNGTVRTAGRPRLYRRSVTYKVYAEVCYPVDLILSNIEKCMKQGAIAATAAAVTGNFPAATVAFQTAFLACMVFSDVNHANQIDIKVAGDTEHGSWTPV